MTTIGELLLIGLILLLWGIGLGLIAGRNRPGLALTYILMSLLAFPAFAQAPLKGSIGPSGYVPPANVSILWRSSGSGGATFTAQLDRSVRFDGSDPTYFGRYGGGVNRSGYSPAAVGGGEWNGGRGWLILRELRAQKGLGPPCGGRSVLCEELIDFLVAEYNRPPMWCEFGATTGQPDPVCGERCPSCTGRPGTPLPTGAVVALPTNVMRTTSRLSFTWPGEGVATANIYARRGGDLWVLRTVRITGPMTVPVVLDLPTESAQEPLVLYLTARKLEPREVLLPAPGGGPPIDPTPIDPPPPPQPPPPPPVDDLDRRLEEFWRLLKPLLRSMLLEPLGEQSQGATEGREKR